MAKKKGATKETFTFSVKLSSEDRALLQNFIESQESTFDYYGQKVLEGLVRILKDTRFREEFIMKDIDDMKF